MKQLGAVYDRDTQILDILGRKDGQETGESIVLLIGYDRKNRDEHKKSIITVLPLLLYLPFEPNTVLAPENWTQKYIKRIVDKHLRWGEKPRSTTERQFYERFIKEKRAQDWMMVEAQSLHIPMAQDFFDSTDYLGLRLFERLSLVYRKKDDPYIHLADGYILHTILPDSKGKIIDEFLTPVFVSDEDTLIVQPSSTSLGKLSLRVPLDSQYTLTALAKRTDSKFKRRTVQYEGENVDGGEELRIDEEVDYQGDDERFVMRVLNNITTINKEIDEQTRDYMVEATTKNKNLHIIKRDDGVTKAFIIHNSVLPYDEKNNVNNRRVKHQITVSLPYLGNEIHKMFSIKVPTPYELRLDPEDYIGLTL